MKKPKIIKKLYSAVKGVTALGLALSITALPLMASSHAEAPLTSMDRYADNTDVYAFRSYETTRSGFVTILANFIPFQDPSGGPQFYRFDDSVVYRINIDNTGDGVEDISYDFRFQTGIVRNTTVLGMNTVNQDGVISNVLDPDYNQHQVYSVTRIRHSNAVSPGTSVLATGIRMPPSNIGPLVTPNYETNLGAPSVHTINSTGMKVFAGQRDEGFFIDVGGVFDLLNFQSNGKAVNPAGTPPSPPPVNEEGGIDTLRGFNVNTIAIEVPIADLTRTGTIPTASTANDAVIGVWSVALRSQTRVLNANGTNGTQTNSGNLVQVSRLGNPLVNEVVIPLSTKDAFNAIRPQGDQDATGVPAALQNPELATFMNARFGLTVPSNRTDLITIFGTGIPLNAFTGQPAGYTTFLNSDGRAHEMMRLNVAIAPTAIDSQNRLGLLGLDVAGYPNGRRPIDDVVDISLRVIAGGTPFHPGVNTPTSPNNKLSDGVCTNYEGFLNRFPYLAPPNQGNQIRPVNSPASCAPALNPNPTE